MAKIFIDGSAGTTGLRIAERLAQEKDLSLITLPEERRKDPAARAEAMAAADLVFLCLPDAAAREAVTLCGADTPLIDTSTAHRTAEGWTYGFPELPGFREKIAKSCRIANPGCHASGFIALTAPLTELGALSPEAKLSCFSLTGYSGGGKKMIGEYEGPDRPAALDAPRQYGLDQRHKHLPEMRRLCGLAHAPAFCPVVADYYSGMEVTVTLFAGDLRCGFSELETLYRDYYSGPVVRYEPVDGAMAGGNDLSGRDGMAISVAGNEERILLIARFDNLGKGASGAAIQNMNLRLGRPETAGLVL